MTESSLVSVPYLFVTTQVQFPSTFSLIVAVLVVFTSTVEFLIIAVYMGGVPVAEHDSLYPGNARTTEGGNVTLGKTMTEQFQSPSFTCFYLKLGIHQGTSRREQLQGLIPQCVHTRKLTLFVGLLVPATSSPRNQTSLIRGASRRDQRCGSCDQNFDAKYEYTLGEGSPKEVHATSPCDQSPSVCRS